MAREDWDTALLTELAQTMQDASICGLGQAAPNPLLSVLKFFPHELEGDGFSPRPSGERAG
jgi:formate dehydrogenase